MGFGAVELLMSRLEETVLSEYREGREIELLRDWEWDPSTGFTESGKRLRL